VSFLVRDNFLCNSVGPIYVLNASLILNPHVEYDAINILLFL